MASLRGYEATMMSNPEPRGRKRSAQGTESAIDPKKPRVLQTETETSTSTICSECAKLDFDEIFAKVDRNGASSSGTLVASLGQRLKDFEVTGCHLCQFLWTQRVPRYNDDPQGYYLWAYSSNSHLDMRSNVVPPPIRHTLKSFLMVESASNRQRRHSSKTTISQSLLTYPATSSALSVRFAPLRETTTDGIGFGIHISQWDCGAVLSQKL